MPPSAVFAKRDLHTYLAPHQHRTSHVIGQEAGELFEALRYYFNGYQLRIPDTIVAIASCLNTFPAASLENRWLVAFG